MLLRARRKRKAPLVGQSRTRISVPASCTPHEKVVNSTDTQRKLFLRTTGASFATVAQDNEYLPRDRTVEAWFSPLQWHDPLPYGTVEALISPPPRGTGKKISPTAL